MDTIKEHIDENELYKLAKKYADSIEIINDLGYGYIDIIEAYKAGFNKTVIDNNSERNKIPISVKLLEFNGFKQEIDGAFTLYDCVHSPDQSYIAISFRKDGTVRVVDILNYRHHFFSDNLPDGYYFDQLLTSLRLCGFNNIADNLKIPNGTVC